MGTSSSDRLAAFLPRFTDAQAQESAIWQANHPTATADEQAAFVQQQEQDLSEFVTQLATWHDAYLTKWQSSPLATQ